MNGLSLGRPPRWLAQRSRLVAAAVLFALMVLVPMILGVCGGTMFAMASALLVGACALLVGNTGFGALTAEREKKTLDSLRLTQLTASEILLGKIHAELKFLGLLLLLGGPTVLLAGYFGPYGLANGLLVLGLAGLSGVMASVYGVFVSSLFDTTSRAVVAGWVGKVIWLLLAPVLDGVLAAVLVQRVSPPVFSSIDPFAALGVLLVPEAAPGARAWLPFLAIPCMMAVTALLWTIATRRFEAGLTAGGGLCDHQTHQAWSLPRGKFHTGIQSLDSLTTNPSFLRELVAQLRAGAGRWPGYAVFLVLFLAPFLYARSWAVKNTVRSLDTPHTTLVQMHYSNTVSLGEGAYQPSDIHNAVSLRTIDGTRLVLKGHTDLFCMRLLLNRWAGVPLPRNALREVVYTDHWGTDRHGTYQCGEKLRPLDQQTASELGYTSSSSERTRAAQPALDDSYVYQQSLALGIAGAVLLLLLYLAIRCSGFLATAVTGERDRRSWEDLALTGISVEQVLRGKLAGALLLPMLQMTAAFSAMLFFVAAGSLSLFEVVAIYLYAVTLAVTAGLLGLWVSAASASSHQAHGRALGLVALTFFLVPLLPPEFGWVAGAGAVGWALSRLLTGTRARSTCGAWLALGVSLLITPAAASPLTAVLGFSPSLVNSQVAIVGWLHPGSVTPGLALVNLVASLTLLGSLGYLFWKSTLDRLGEPRQQTALRAELSAS